MSNSKSNSIKWTSSWVEYIESSPEKSSGYSSPGWYFWTPEENYAIGPFKSQSRAQIACNVFATTAIIGVH